MAWRLRLTRRLCTAAASSATPSSGPPSRASHPLFRRLFEAESVAGEMDTWLREKNRTSQELLLSFVKDLRRFHNYYRALGLLDWMKERGMPMTPGTHAIKLDLIAKTKGIQDAEHYFSSLPPEAKTAKTYSALLIGYTQSKMEEQSLSLFSQMQRLNFVTANLPYNNLMTLFMAVNRPEKIPDLFSQMKAHNLSPDSYSYSILAKASGLLKDDELFERVLTELREDPLFEANWHLCSTFASVYISFGKFEEAESELKRLEEKMNKTEREPYHFLITLYAGSVWRLSTKPILLSC